jgi:hypothetical protein
MSASKNHLDPIMVRQGKVRERERERERERMIVLNYWVD